MTVLRCEKEPVRPDHINWNVYMTTLRCVKEPVRPDHMGGSRVWCVNDIWMYYESLILLMLGWNRNLICENIYIFLKKLSSLSFFLCVVCFVFLNLRWSCILHMSREFDRWCESPMNWWRNFILFYCNFRKIFLLNLIWRSLFWNIYEWIYGYLYFVLI